MALKVAKSRELPTGAIRLDRNEAIRYQENRIENWKNPSQTWFIRNGAYLMAAGAAVSAFSFMKFFWWRLRVGKGSLGYLFVPTMLVPAAAAAVVHEKLLKEPLIIQEFTCPVCAEIRGSLLQTATGVGQSYIMALLSSISAAQTTFSYPIPELKIYSPAKFFKFVKKLCKESKNRVGYMLFLNIALSAFVTYKLNEEVLLINSDTAGSELEGTISEFQ